MERLSFAPSGVKITWLLLLSLTPTHTPLRHWRSPLYLDPQKKTQDSPKGSSLPTYLFEFTTSYGGSPLLVTKNRLCRKPLCRSSQENTWVCPPTLALIRSSRWAFSVNACRLMVLTAFSPRRCWHETLAGPPFAPHSNPISHGTPQRSSEVA